MGEQRQRSRERERETQRQADTQRETGGQREAERQRDRETKRQTHGGAQRQRCTRWGEGAGEVLAPAGVPLIPHNHLKGSNTPFGLHMN